jgi:subtilase family serine protease
MVDRVTQQFVTAHASVAQIERAFGARMATYRESTGRLRVGSTVALNLPAALIAAGADVEGLIYMGEDRPMYRLGPKVTEAIATGSATPFNRYGPNGPLWFDDIKQAYQYPAYTYANGKGVTVATINEADFSSKDLEKYLAREKIGGNTGDLAPLPKFGHVLLPGAPPFGANSTSAEADLDTQQIAGTAPGALVEGYTTDAIDSPVDFLQAYDEINYGNSADIVNLSYGSCELFFTAAYNGGHSFLGILHAMHDTYLQGNSQGITYTVSSGDSAGLQCPELGYITHPGAGKKYVNIPSVSSPASDPNVVAVGGGNLITSADPANPKDLNSTYVSENANADPEPAADDYGFGNTLTNNYWGAGTGQSSIWGKPAWQHGITRGVTRSVPDVGLFVGGCLPNDPAFVQPCAPDVSHALMIYAGVAHQVIGTSVAAPEFAGLLADLEQLAGSGTVPGSGRLGNVGPSLYADTASAFHKGIPGFDGVGSFGGGHGHDKWIPAYGLGSVFNAIPYLGPAAGTPQTATNP